ncbi:MAG: hypothetical protein KGD73_01660 [Candidatus Lokiarchaeota archaeon]|nr:hypothetical protein [Candidatus Lokiarchaeota archaeon]
MVDLKKRIWIFPLISIIFSILSLSLPVAYREHATYNSYFWLSALNLRTDTGALWYNSDPLAITGAVLEILVIVIAMILLLFSVIRIYQDKLSEKLAKLNFLVSGLLLILSPLGYIILANLYVSDFWSIYIPFFGIISPFIAAGISILTIFLYKRE